MKLQNLLEEEVIMTVNKLIDNVEGTCKCDKCKLDIVALTLNNLQPRYVVTNEGCLYGRVNNMNQQFNTDVLLQVTKSIEVVSKNPQHED